MNADYIANPERYSKIVHTLYGGEMPLRQRPLSWNQAVYLGQLVDMMLGSASTKAELTKSIGTHGIEILEGLGK